MPERVVVLGATGYTGRLVAARLRSRELEFVLAGRDPDGLNRLAGELDGPDTPKTRAVDLQDAGSLAWLADPDHVVINCVGPFNLYARGLVEAVARTGGTYLDITGEEPFVAHTQSRWNDLARKTGALIVHACAFESLPADLLAASICGPDTEYDDVSSFYRLPGSAISPGTHLTMRLASHWPTTMFLDGAFVRRAPGSFGCDIDHTFLSGFRRAVFAPYPEIRFWPSRILTRSAGSYLALTASEAGLVTRVGGVQARSVEEIVARHRRRPRTGPTSEQRRGQRFTIAVVAREQSGSAWAAHLRGTDPYALTAAIATWAAEQISARPKERRPSGVRSPAEVFDAGDFFEEAMGWEFELSLGEEEVGAA